MNESECYARLYGDRESTVAVIRKVEPERPSGGLLGEHVRKLADLRDQLLGATDPSALLAPGHDRAAEIGDRRSHTVAADVDPDDPAGARVELE